MLSLCGLVTFRNDGFRVVVVVVCGDEKSFRRHKRNPCGLFPDLFLRHAQLLKITFPSTRTFRHRFTYLLIGCVLSRAEFEFDGKLIPF